MRPSENCRREKGQLLRSILTFGNSRSSLLRRCLMNPRDLKRPRCICIFYIAELEQEGKLYSVRIPCNRCVPGQRNQSNIGRNVHTSFFFSSFGPKLYVSYICGVFGVLMLYSQFKESQVEYSGLYIYFAGVVIIPCKN